MQLPFRKYVYSEDYDPTYHDVRLEAESSLGIERLENNMELEGVFYDDERYKTILLDGRGLVRTELETISKGYCENVQADKLITMNKFQIPMSEGEMFLDMAEAVYGYKCELGETVEEKIINDYGNEEIFEVHTDLVLIKEDGTRNHFKRLSDGEKKIATVLQKLCDSEMREKDIVLVDNIEMHIYAKRHGVLIDKILEHSASRQFFLTTHSVKMIQHICKKHGEESLIDLDVVKGREKDSSWIWE
jgi:hypothetical protein